MLRVAMITDHSGFDDKVDGGVQAVTKYLVDALTLSDAVDLHVVSFRYGLKEKTSSGAKGYTQHVLPGARFGILTGYCVDQRSLNALLDTIEPSIVHGQGAGRNGVLAVRCGRPSVITVHGIMAEEARYLTGTWRRTRHRLLSLLSDHYCIKRAKHTILVSPYVARYFGSRLSGKHYLVPNPIADSFFNIARHDDSNRVLFAGRLRPLKGVMDLIRATAIVAKSQAVQLILAGSMDNEHYVDELRKEIRKLGITEIVRFSGLLDEKELRTEVGRCALLVLPSYQETAPMVIAEAMAAGLPVIATDVGGIRHQIKDGETGFLVKPGDVTGLSQRLIALLSDRPLRVQFDTSAKKLATVEYQADRVAGKTIGIYKQVLSGLG